MALYPCPLCESVVLSKVTLTPTLRKLQSKLVLPQWSETTDSGFEQPMTITNCLTQGFSTTVASNRSMAILSKWEANHGNTQIQWCFSTIHSQRYKKIARLFATPYQPHSVIQNWIQISSLCLDAKKIQIALSHNIQYHSNCLNFLILYFQELLWQTGILCNEKYSRILDFKLRSPQSSSSENTKWSGCIFINIFLRGRISQAALPNCQLNVETTSEVLNSMVSQTSCKCPPSPELFLLC